MKEPHLRLIKRIESKAQQPDPHHDANFFREIETPGMLNSPTVLVFGGSNINDTRKASGLSKRVQIMLGRHECQDNDVQVCAAVYPWSGDDLRKVIQAYTAEKIGHRDPHLEEDARQIDASVKKELKHFVRTHLLPLVATNVMTDDNGRVEGKLRPMPEAVRNMRNLNIVAHSFGTHFVEHMGDMLSADLARLGCNQAQADLLCKQVFVISMGDVAPIDRSHFAHFSTMHFTNQQDYVIAGHTPPNGNAPLAERILDERRTSDKKSPIVIVPIRQEDEPGGANRWMAALRNIPAVRRLQINGDVQIPDYSGHEFGSYALLGYPERLIPDTTGRSDPEKERIAKYCEKLEQKSLANIFTVPILVASLLRNAVNNSMENADPKKDFTDIPSIQEMAVCKKPSEFLFKTNCTAISEPYSNLHKLAKGIGYEERIQGAIVPDTGSPTVNASAPQVAR